MPLQRVISRVHVGSVQGGGSLRGGQHAYSTFKRASWRVPQLMGTSTCNSTFCVLLFQPAALPDTRRQAGWGLVQSQSTTPEVCPSSAVC